MDLSDPLLAKIFGASIPILVFLALARFTQLALRHRALALGAGAVLPWTLLLAAPYVRDLIAASPRQAPFLVGFGQGAGPEELLKMAALLLLSRVPPFRMPGDALGAATGIACGFAASENVLILWAMPHALRVATSRLSVALPAHLAYAAITAAIIGAAWRTPPLAVAIALVAAIVMHGVVDGLSFAGRPGAADALVALGILGTAWMWRREFGRRPDALDVR